MVYPIAKWLVMPPVKIWLKEVIGAENLPKSSGFIIAANHLSYMDHFFLGYAVILKLNRKLHFLAKKEHFDSTLEATWHKYGGAIPIERSARGSKSLKIAVSYLKKGSIIGIYPEGTRSLTGKMNRGKTGIARLALEAKVPVIPVGIIGTFEILPKGSIIPKLKKGYLHFGRPIYLDRYYNKKITKKLLRHITDSIMKDVAKLSGQKYNF